MSDKIFYNQLEIKTFHLTFDRMPNVLYHCTSAPLPGITATPVHQQTPFTTVKHHGDNLVFQPLIVSFIVDENLRNHSEVFDWMVSYGTPGSFDEYKDERRDLYQSKFSDATLVMLNNKYNPIAEYRFEDAFPIDVSDLMNDHQVDDVLVSTCTATFEYTKYTRVR